MPTFRYERIHVSSEDAFIQQNMKLLEQGIADAIAQRGHCILGLSGGSTPGPIYRELGRSKSIDWSKVTLFLVDERYVSEDDPQSNQRMVRETLLTSLRDASIRASTSAGATQHDVIGVFPNTTLLIEECVKDYEEQLRNLLPDQEIDLVILGLGEDGHIASLFPGDMNALLERERWVLPTETEKFAVHNRVTVTLPLLEKARKMLFLLKGDEKKKIFAEVISANVDPIEYPAHALLQTGRTVWITGW
ncbi:MAG: 6-phosphogluconolactonase [Patescibacteria group bacterium]